MDNATLNKFLTKKHACSESKIWRAGRDLTTAWAECDRGDWLLWFAAKAGIDRKRLVMAACACAREALQFVPAGEDRPRIAIETAEAWCRGEATIEQVGEGRNAAHAAAAAAYAAYAARAKIQRKTADIVRGLITVAEVDAAMRGAVAA